MGNVIIRSLYKAHAIDEVIFVHRLLFFLGVFYKQMGYFLPQIWELIKVLKNALHLVWSLYHMASLMIIREG